MPTREQMDRVTSGIEILTAGLYVVCLEEGRVIPPSPGHEGGYYFWDDLSESQRPEALTVAIDWTGFTDSQREGVIGRVLEGDESDFWMDGIEEGYPSPDELKALAAEIRADEHAARVRDYGEVDAATYEQRVAEGASTIQHLDPLPEPVPAGELERALSEIERQWATPEERLKAILNGDVPGVEQQSRNQGREHER